MPKKLHAAKIKRNSAELSKNSSDDTKIISLSRLRRAKRIKFYHNGNKFFKGVVVPVSKERYGSLDNLMNDLTLIFNNRVTLPYGVRIIYSKTGRKISKIDDLEEGEEYVCSAGESYKKIDYGKSDTFVSGYSGIVALPPLSSGSKTMLQVNKISIK